MSILGGWEPHFSAECSLVGSDVAEQYFLKCNVAEQCNAGSDVVLLVGEVDPSSSS